MLTLTEPTVPNRQTTAISLPHIPVPRRGRPYESLDKINVVNYRTGETIAQVSTVNAGIIRKDLQRVAESRAALKKFTVAQLIEISAKAGELFLNGALPLGDPAKRDHTQSPEDYVRTLSSTSGLPHVMVRRNMTKIHHALTHLQTVLNGLSRGLDLAILANKEFLCPYASVVTAPQGEMLKRLVTHSP